MTKLSELVETVKKLGAENPDKKAQCSYFHGNGQPCCIVGAALYEHGIKRKDLRIEDDLGYPVDFNEGTGVVSLLERVGVPLGIEMDVDSSVTELLEAVQEAQDGGLPWGEAIRRLDPEFNEDDEEEEY